MYTTSDPAGATARYAVERLWTDTVAWEIVARTAKTITVRSMAEGAIVKNENRDGNPWPVTRSAAVPDPNAKCRKLRLRKDGTYRFGSGANPLRFTDEPFFVTDWRF